MLSHSLLAFLALAGSAATSALPRQATTACTNPVVRKEWRELTGEEKAEYLRAAVCVRNLPSKHYKDISAVTKRLDDLVFTHITLTLDIHFVANFLPWHRWFLQQHEKILRDECGFKGTQPYWDWSIEGDAVSMPESPLFDAKTGFGGNGVRTNNPEPGFGMCVVDGPFANTTLTIGMGYPDPDIVGNRKHCFTRNFNNGWGNDEDGNLIIGDMQASAYTTTVMKVIHKFDTYSRMSDMLEGLPHAQIHSIIFGDMGPATSPNEPLFMLHHANVDRAWARWQGRNNTRLVDYTGFNDRNKNARANINDPMPQLELAGTAPLVKDYMDTMAGTMCYTYSKMSAP
ncbi:tyrosinase [Microdochium nivale]|nr:tyrosinase [Microdochium nivale]